MAYVIKIYKSNLTIELPQADYPKKKTFYSNGEYIKHNLMN